MSPGWASRSIQMHPEASRCTQRHPEASRHIKRHQGAPRRHPEAPRSTQRHPEASRGSFWRRTQFCAVQHHQNSSANTFFGAADDLDNVSGVRRNRPGRQHTAILRVLLTRVRHVRVRIPGKFVESVGCGTDHMECGPGDMFSEMLPGDS